MPLQVNLTPAVKKELEKAQAAAEAAKAAAAVGGAATPTIPIGTTCRNNACEIRYSGSESLCSPCQFHPGAPGKKLLSRFCANY